MTAIKVTESKDLHVLAALNQEAQDLHHKLHPEIFKPYEPESMLQAFQVMFSGDSYKAFIAYVDEEPVGYILINLRQTGENAFHYNIRSIYIDQIAVRSSYRNKGIAKLLIDKAIELARQLNIQNLELDHWTSNSTAANYFRKQGFVLRKERLHKAV